MLGLKELWVGDMEVENGTIEEDSDVAFWMIWPSPLFRVKWLGISLNIQVIFDTRSEMFENEFSKR